MDSPVHKEMPVLSSDTKLFSLFFRIGMWWRVLYGFLKFVFGTLLLLVAASDLPALFYRFMRHELIEDPGDLLVRLASPVIGYIAVSTGVFVALYLVFWGIVDVFLSVNILRRKMWAYPVALALIVMFTLYELYRLTYTHSLVLAFVIIIDFFVIWLINKEYTLLRENSSER